MLGSLCDPRVGTAASLVDDLFLNFEVTTWTSEPHTTGVFFGLVAGMSMLYLTASLSRSLWSYRDKRKLPTVWQHVSLSSFFLPYERTFQEICSCIADASHKSLAAKTASAVSFPTTKN